MSNMITIFIHTVTDTIFFHKTHSVLFCFDPLEDQKLHSVPLISENTHLGEWQNDDWNVLSENYSVSFLRPRFMTYIKGISKNTSLLDWSRVPAGSLTKPKVQQSRYSRLTQSLSQSTCIVLWMNFAQVSPNNSEMTTDIVSQIRGCDKQACFMSLLWFLFSYWWEDTLIYVCSVMGEKTLFTDLRLSAQSNEAVFL